MRIKLLLAAIFAFSVSGVASATITFTDGDDYLVTNAENYEEIAVLGELHAGGGDDYVNVGGYDLERIAVYGEEGNDELWGSDHNAILDGGPGDDIFHGGAHESYVWGGPGNDTFSPNRGTGAAFYYRGLDEIRGFVDHFNGGWPSTVHFEEFTVAFLEKYLFAIPGGGGYYKLGLRGHDVGIFAEITPIAENVYGGPSIHGIDGSISIASITVPEPETMALFMVGLFGLWRIKRRSPALAL
ncbi:MAG: PEP-CTERM sorting domain-containing protein [Nitrococcus mobilis]|nr:PEP-CTERM sorting domain-containing protein [Nitrococcus mobilis]